MDYTAMRQFADSWGLLGMAVFFIIAIGFALRPGARSQYEEAARIPFKNDDEG